MPVFPAVHLLPNFLLIRYRKVVGDNCTVQTMSPYAPVDKPCPAVPPDGLVIKITEDITSGVSAKQELNFTLTQDKVNV